MHKVRKGILFDVFYDTETTDLDKRFSEILQFGGLVTDLAGNILHTVDFRAKPSPYSLISPYAWVIQRLNEDRLEHGESQYFFAGRVMQFFRQASQLDKAAHQQQFLDLCGKKRTFKFSDGTSSKYYPYPLLDDNGQVDWNSLRVDEGLKKLYFYDEETDEWHKRNIAAMTYGYNNINADDQWLWTLLHMAGAENIFVTHLAQSGKYRTDVLRMVEAAVAAGPKGEHGIKAGSKKDPRTGSQVPSFSQGDILEANDHISSEVRNVIEGIVLPDGSRPDIHQLHGAFKDSFALAGILRFLRRQVPDIVQQMERNSIWKDVVEDLTEKTGSFGNHPIKAYVDKSYPYLTGMMVTLLGTDQYRHNPKVALIYNLGIDPATFRFNGKPLKELTPDEHAHLIKKGIGNQNGIYKIIRTHQSPRLLDHKTGFTAGFNNDLDMPELHKRAKFLRNQELQENIMKGLRIAQPRLEGPDRILLPQPEEELFTFSTLEMYDPEAGEDVQIHLVKNRLERLAQDARSHAIQIKGFWLKAIEPDEDILLNDFDSVSAKEFEAVEIFNEKIQKLNKKLKENNGQLLPEPDEDVVDKKTALNYKIKLLFYARNHFAVGDLKDVGHHFWFEDSHGVRIPERDLKEWPEWRLNKAYQSGNLQIRHEPLYVTAPLIDRILESLECEDLLGDDVKGQMESAQSLRLHGIPSLNEKNRWLTLKEAERQVQKILNNELMDEDVKAIERRLPGVWKTFVTNHHDAQSSLGSYISYLEKQKVAAPQLTPVRMARAGVHPVTGSPIEMLDYKVDIDHALAFIVPDRYLEKPPTEPIDKQPVWLVGITKPFNKTSLANEIKAGRDIILQGAATGKTFHLPKARIISLPARGGAWEDFYKAATARYEESGMEMSPKSKLFALSGEGPYPIHDVRPLDMPSQTLRLEKSYFEGLLNHRFGGYQSPVQGVIVRDDGLDVKEGSVRLLETENESDTPSGWEVSTQVLRARRLSTADIEEMDNDDASKYGFLTTDHMLGHVITLFTDKQLDPNNSKNTVWVIDFENVNAFDPTQGTAFFNPEVQKISGRRIDYEVLAETLDIAA